MISLFFPPLFLCRTRESTLETFRREKPFDRGSAADPSVGSSPTSTLSSGPTVTLLLTEWWVQASFLSSLPGPSAYRVWEVSEIGGSASSSIISAFDSRFRCLFVLVALASLHTHCWATFWFVCTFFSNKCFFAVFYFLHHTAPVGNTNTLEVGAPVETLRIITLSLLVLSHGDTRSKARHQEFMSLWIYYAAGTRHSFNCMKI